MIISASRRTDIPAFYSEWFMNRLTAGNALIPNPRNANRLGYVELTPDKVDCIVFWTKNPLPMLDKFSLITSMGYSYYMQFTLTPYDNRIESKLPPKSRLLDTFIEMSRLIGAKRSVWRYDPIVVDATHCVSWHLQQFAAMCEKLQGFTQRCLISFVDPYKSLHDRYRALTKAEMLAVASGLSEIATGYGIGLYTCAEEIELSRYGVAHGACIDQPLIEEIIGRPITAKNDANQRSACRCIESVDIGAYDTCTHGCTYCYATSSLKTASQRSAAHDPCAPMILGYPKGHEIITNRTTPSQIDNQLSLF